MATIAAPGIGSGLDVDNIVRQLVELEAQPLVNLQKQTGELENRLSAYGQLVQSVEAFTNAIESISFDSSLESEETLAVGAPLESLQRFVDAYNILQQRLDEISKEYADDPEVLRAIRLIDGGVEDVFYMPSPGIMSYPASAGLIFDRSGTLAIDEKLFHAVWQENPEAVGSYLFDPETGLVRQFISIAENLTTYDGVIDGQEKALNEQLRAQQQDVVEAQNQLALTEERLRQEYSELDVALSGMQRASSQLSQQLGALNVSQSLEGS